MVDRAGLRAREHRLCTAGAHDGFLRAGRAHGKFVRQAASQCIAKTNRVILRCTGQNEQWECIEQRIQSIHRAPSMRPASPRYGVARAISKLGMGSRTQAANWLKAGQVRVNGRLVTDPEFPVSLAADRIAVAGLES